MATDQRWISLRKKATFLLLFFNAKNDVDGLELSFLRSGNVGINLEPEPKGKHVDEIEGSVINRR